MAHAPRLPRRLHPRQPLTVPSVLLRTFSSWAPRGPRGGGDDRAHASEAGLRAVVATHHGRGQLRAAAAHDGGAGAAGDYGKHIAPLYGPITC